jgi:hypothetical protein
MTARLVANELAREDWRDALVVAGLGGSDWPAKLNEALGRPRISPRLWTYPFHAQSWDEIQDEYTALASRDTSLAAWAAIANSVGASPAKGQLAGRLRQTMECGLVVVAEMPVAQEAHFREGDEDGPSGCCLLGEGVDDRQVRRDVVGHRLELDGGDSRG